MFLSVVNCESALGYIKKSESSVLYPELVDLLLLVHAQLAWAHVDQEKETAAVIDVRISKLSEEH
jgi:hypothetical protein